MKCPQYGCPAKPSITEIKSIVSDDVFEKYLNLHQDLIVAQDRENLFYCSNTKCKNVINKKTDQSTNNQNTLFFWKSRNTKLIACSVC